MIRKWKSVLDEQTCDACRDLHGRVIWPDEQRPPLHVHTKCKTCSLYCDLSPDCRCASEPADVLAIGERFNYHKWWRPVPANEYSFDLRKRLGFYNRRTPGSRRTFLDSLGVEWTNGINLLWPSPVVGYWDPQEAKKVAETLLPEIWKYDAVLLFGKHVCEAFGAEYAPLKRQGTYVPMPHPSGQCRMWNDCKFLMDVRRFFK